MICTERIIREHYPEQIDNRIFMAFWSVFYLFSLRYVLIFLTLRSFYYIKNELYLLENKEKCTCHKGVALLFSANKVEPLRFFQESLTIAGGKKETIKLSTLFLVTNICSKSATQTSSTTPLTCQRNQIKYISLCRIFTLETDKQTTALFNHWNRIDLPGAIQYIWYSIQG